MKLYATVASERAMKGQGGNKELAISLALGSKGNSKSVLHIRARVLPPEASISEKESVVVMIMKEDETGFVQELTERLVYSLPSCVEIHNRYEALALKGEKQKGEMDKFIESVDLPQ